MTNGYYLMTDYLNSWESGGWLQTTDNMSNCTKNDECWALCDLTKEQEKHLPEDIQKLRKVGFIDQDLILNCKGREALLDLLYKEHQGALVKEAESIISEWETKD